MLNKVNNLDSVISILYKYKGGKVKDTFMKNVFYDLLK